MKDTIYVFGNWKMNMTEKETTSFFERFMPPYGVIDKNTDHICSVVVFPPYTSIPETRNCVEDYFQRQKPRSPVEWGARRSLCTTWGVYGRNIAPYVARAWMHMGASRT